MHLPIDLKIFKFYSFYEEVTKMEHFLRNLRFLF